MKKRIITIAGRPGSGKSTIRTKLAARLGYDTFSTGDFTRKLAAGRGQTLEEFNREVAHDKATDLQIDAEVERIARNEDEIIVDSILAFHFIPDSFKVFLSLPLEESARRIMNDTNPIRKESGDVSATIEEAMEQLETRIANHTDRYWRHYGIDPYDTSQYDLIVDTHANSPDEVVELIVTAYEKWQNEE